MPAEKYHRQYLEEQLPAELGEQLRADGLDPTRLPSYEYLNAKGFETRGLNNAIQRHFGEDMTLQQFLRAQGFGHGVDGDWPCSHEQTISHLNGFRKSRRDRHDDVDPTVGTIESALRKALRLAQKLHGTDNLVSFARYESDRERVENNEKVIEILDEMKDSLGGRAFDNYRGYLRTFYEYVDTHATIDYNPVIAVQDEYDSTSTSESSPQPPSDEHIKTLWRTVKQLPDRNDLHADVQGLIARHGLGTWQLYMLCLLSLGVGTGPRAKDYIRTNCLEDWKFGDEPYIDFDVRKNLPNEVPILARANFLTAYRDYMRETRPEWNGKPFPSSSSASGSRTTSTLNNWLKALCKEAGVRLDDGSLPTLQNLRQTWHTEYKKVLRKDDVQVQLVADDAGTKNPKIVDEDYLPPEEMREMIRDNVTKDLNELLPLSDLPDVMTDILDQDAYMDRQTGLAEFSSE